MAKLCRVCQRPKHSGLCDMVELASGSIIHASRVEPGGDLHGEKIRNRWIKKNLKTSKEKKKARKT